MSELTSQWASTSLDELLTTLESGSRPRGGVRGIAKGVPSIGGEHLCYDGTFDFSNIKYVPHAFANGMTKGRIQTGDILIVKDGATTGKTAFVDYGFPFKDAFVNEHVFICRPSPHLEPRFLFRYLMSKEGRERVLENFKGSAQGGINQSFAPNTEVPLAPFNEQRRIVAKLEKVLGAVEDSQKRLVKIPVLLKRFRQSVLAAACSGRLTADWREINSNIESGMDLLKKINSDRKNRAAKDTTTSHKRRAVVLCDFEFGSDAELPSTWAKAKLDGLIYIAGRIGWRGLKAEEYTKTGPVLLSVFNLNYGETVNFEKVNRISKERYEESPEIQLRPSDILLAKDGAGIGKIGFVTQLPEKATVNSSLLLVRALEAFVPKYLFYFLSGPDLQNLAKARISGSATPHLFQKDIKQFYLSVPPLSEQQEIVRRVEALFALADKIETRYKKAKAQVDKLAQSILAKAFRGELVPQDPTDEPASKLLERIKKEKLR